MKSIEQQVAENVKRLRKIRNYSLDQLSALTGVSKGMLAQIEKGASSPTITTLWKIANGLQVSFTSLAEKPAGEPAIVRKSERAPVTAGDDRYAAFPHFPFDQKKKFEIFYIELLPGCVHESEPHHGGIEEYVLVSKGTVAVSCGDYSCELREGDAMHFTANTVHKYENKTEQTATGYTLIYYP
ncbi:XRE family transcriptional regulator [Bacillus glycinifermentans]|uniref:XRE family transcriptional regulator n=1 Tax=Bacillus glycinifermentans TaxID=1664069 RepID=A0A0J6ES08_9BACI|nr:XRE family transcriptional regulator [Bacillus glycinifermentans]ATH94961.1 XRE family transcriptional regulator [Bacillus glycinifermentans]KMM57935.1 XRE family transcriptional regulator [Bacillus glycinifermentans]KRT93149.1 XRE family transcriptional regulator [Bacillus glycinifermentans]MEC0487678.1 XRE family transcriptional regulator [Bacillus glycinifermentans]MEC0495720.1 XRE family transcriptional regulator [Bacillus glycinifermentans]